MNRYILDNSSDMYGIGQISLGTSQGWSRYDVHSNFLDLVSWSFTHLGYFIYGDLGHYMKIYIA